MEDYEQDYYIQWIIADYTPFEYNGKQYFLSTPIREQRFLAERIFTSTLKNALEEGLYNKTELLLLLQEENLWSAEKEQLLENLQSDIDNIKVNIFESYTQSTKKQSYKKALSETYKQIEILLSERSSMDYLGAEAVAQQARQNFLIGSSIYKRKKQPLLRGNWWLERDDDIIQHCYKELAQYNLSDKDYRELARSPSWRNVWNSKKSVGSLFGTPVVDLSLPQKQLVMWSNIYDSVYKSGECPSDNVIEDDDALDGWMIIQKRKRDKENNQSMVDKNLGNDKIRNSDQVFVMCDPQDAQKVYECNDAVGKMRYQRIMNQVKKEGTVNIMDLTDTKLELMRKASSGG